MKVFAAQKRHLPVFKTQILQLLWLGIIVLVLSCSSSKPVFDGQRAYTHLQKFFAIGPKVPGTAQHQKGLEYLQSMLKPLADSLVLQSFEYTDPKSNTSIRLTNLLARFHLTAPKRVLLCAHWDNRPYADEDPDPANRNQPVPGANDGCSGTAVLLEIARIIKSHPPPVGIDLIFFDGEDYGSKGNLDQYFLGSRYFSQHLPQPIPEYAILLDMVGDRQLQIYQEEYSYRYAPRIVTRIWKKARQLNITAFRDTLKYKIEDDHLMLLLTGIPACVLIDFDYPWWHTVNDTPDKCSPQSLGQVGKVITGLLYD